MLYCPRCNLRHWTKDRRCWVCGGLLISRAIVAKEGT